MAEKAWGGNSGLTYPLAMIRGLRLFSKYRASTMIGPRAYAENLALIAVALQNPALDRGSIIECGTWRGGMSAGMIGIAGANRKYDFFDSFEGLPPAGEHDGQKRRTTSAIPRRQPITTIAQPRSRNLKKPSHGQAYRPRTSAYIKGFFEETLPTFNCPPIAVLRLDADWYESTMICLEKFWDHILPGGLLLIDDYHVWEGCTRAVHAFLAKRDATESVKQGPIGRVAFIVKNPS